ncbi:Uma2 family endonuclease [Tepidibacillus sp. LV47]|uniref:Uma2 family endonuclease n=1 Tax=Tepidibacillus sp. LV47 TaxID=3398228 RepID=UPI003AAFD648
MSRNAKNYEYFTYEEFEKIQNDEPNFRLEYDNGYIYYMTPVYPNHDRVKNKIANTLINHLGFDHKCEVFTSDVAVVFENENEKYEFAPDIMITCDPEKFKGAKYKGVPSLIVEILSYSTEHRDKGLKLDVYQRFGVKEYWIVDINKNKIIVYNSNVNGEFMSVNTYTRGMTLKCLGRFDLAVDDIFRVVR